MAENIVTKSVVSVTEMAKMVGLSRARFYQLVRRGTFPVSDLDTLSKRPCYCEEKQRLILEARRRNCGVDGKPILFYSRRRDFGQVKVSTRPVKPKATNTLIADIIDHLSSAKVVVTTPQVEAAVRAEYPQGTEGTEFAVVLNRVFDRLRGQNPSDKVG